ncbi:MAG: phosphomannomutase/phosphoglucomutase [Myxococcota bacterium]
MKINPDVFRMYDIRGIAEKDFPKEFVYTLGRAYATMAGAKGVKAIALGRDCRKSSDSIFKNLVEGLTEGGVSIYDIGVVHTPAMYWSLFNLPVQGGIMITASHNPPEYNGFKVAIGRATIYGDEIQELRKVMEKGEFVKGNGRIEKREIIEDYISYIVGNIRIPEDSKPLKVVVDGGNGTAGGTGAEVLKRLGQEVIELYCDMDGSFPNHEADPTVVDNLKDLIAEMKRSGADIGIAYDGDGDRIGVIAKGGKIIWGDTLLLVFARSILKEKPGATFVSEVKCSQVIYDEIERAGGKAIMWKTGHSLIKSKMKESGAELAGEMSGHIFFANRYFGFDDAVYASARLVELLLKDGKSITRLIADIPQVYNTPEIRMDCPEEKKFAISEKARVYFADKAKEIITVDGVRVIFEDGAWGLIRASNTQPVLVLRFEAKSEKRRDQIKEEFIGKIKEWIG